MSTLPHFPHMLASDGPAADRLVVSTPFDQSPIATIDLVGPSGVQQALESAHGAYLDRNRWLAPHERVAILQKARDIMLERADELACEAAREGGKPLIDSQVEVARAIDGMALCIEALRTSAGEEIPMGLSAASVGRLAFTRHEPIGVVVAVSAFNHPLNLIVHQVGPAIAAGCPVIVKPAPDTPLSCLHFIRILRQAGLPEEWAQALLTTDNDTTAGLVTDRRVGFFSFIGSAQVGWQLRSQLAPGTRCALEHGGAAPVIMQADADLQDALPLLAKGGFYHAGQVCVSVQRLYVHSSIAREVAQKLAQLGKRMKVGDALLPDTEIGPLIRPGEVQRIHAWVQEAVSAGAELLSGGAPLGDTCYPATVLYDPPDEARVSRLEIFGPVVCVYPFEDTDEAIKRANALPYAFQASVFTKQIDQALHAYRQLEASAVMINDMTAFRVDWMPFAGLRQSGLGVGGIAHTFDDMQVRKMAIIRSPAL